MKWALLFTMWNTFFVLNVFFVLLPIVIYFLGHKLPDNVFFGIIINLGAAILVVRQIKRMIEEL